MDYIKIVLLVYLVLRISNIINSYNLTLDNILQNCILLLLLILLGAHDQVVCLMVIVGILINLPNEFKETLFTNINKKDIESIVKETLYRPFSNFIKEENISFQDNNKSPLIKPNNPKKKVTFNNNIDESCIPEFIISKDMLFNAQNNIYDQKNMYSFPNETKQKHINIQGIYDDISGYND